MKAVVTEAIVFIIISCSVVVLTLSLFFMIMRYPYGDAWTYLEMAGSLRSSLRMKSDFVTVGPEGFEGDFGDDIFVGMAHANVFLNLVKLFPPPFRLLGAQLINLGFWIAFLILWCASLYVSLLQFTFFPAPLLLLVSVSLMLLLGSRVKLIYLVAGGYSELINYAFLFLSVLMAVYVSPSSPLWPFGGMGFALGIAVRNRKTDIVLMAAALLLTAYMKRWDGAAVVVIAAMIANGDILAACFTHRDRERMPYLSGILRHYIALSSQEENRSPLLFSVISLLGRAIIQMVNPYHAGSLWNSIGGGFLFLPYSVYYIAINHLLVGVTLYLVLLIVLYITPVFFIQKKLGTAKGDFYFGDRQCFVLFPISFWINSFASCYSLSIGDSIFPLLWGGYLVFYLIEQFYRAAQHYFSDAVVEPGVPVFQKDPDQFRIDLSEFIKQRDVGKRMVLLGYYLQWGEIYDHIKCNSLFRIVSLIEEVSDQRLKYLIKKYNVTHIVVTPMSGFISRNCSLRDNILGNELRQFLVRHDFSPTLTVYEVVSP